MRHRTRYIPGNRKRPELKLPGDNMTAASEFFVNLPLRYIYTNPDYLDIFIERKIQPELGLDCLGGECLDRKWLEGIRQRLDEAGLSCTVHLPFLDLKPGSLNRAIRGATIEIMTSALDIARMFSPQRMVMHPSLTSWLEPDLFEKTFFYCCETVIHISDHWPGHPPICLENTHELSPDPLVRMVEHIDRENVGICFDLGHWFSFSKGMINQDFDRWFDAFAPHIRHIHLHDNDGDRDAHLALGQGKMDWEHIITRINELSPRPTMTLEPHNRKDFEASMDYFKNRILPKLIQK